MHAIQIKNLIKSGLGSAATVLGKGSKSSLKHRMELLFWKRLHRNIEKKFQEPSRREAEFVRQRAHYEGYFTSFFDIPKSYYDNKKILDIGCRPLGSLEWAENAALRVGLDPLADQYRRLNQDRQQMVYCQAVSEHIPYNDMEFDIVSSLNSLDHVEDLALTLSEIKRVVKPGGRIIIITEIDHKPTLTEPIVLTADDIITPLAATCNTLHQRYFGVRLDHQVWKSIGEKTPYIAGKPGLLCMLLEKL